MSVQVLVVDDNPIIRDSVMMAVAKLNAKIGGTEDTIELWEAGDGATAWDRIVENDIELLIVDLYIPILDGLELIGRVREHPQKAATKILAISASIQDARVRSLGAGADQFLQKPIRLVDLMDAMGNLLRLDLS